MRMIWQENIASIVMVTALEEKGESKCIRYFPEAHSNMTFGDITITWVSETLCSGYIRSIYHVTKEDSAFLKFLYCSILNACS